LVQSRLAETNRDEFCQVIHAFTKLDETCNLIIFKYFEDFYIFEITSYYQQKSKELRLENNILLYMQKALDCFDHEHQITHNFSLDRSWNVTKTIFINEIIGSYSDKCLEDRAFIKTLRSGDKNNIRTHYEFLHHTHYTKVVDNYSIYIEECIKELPNDTGVMDAMMAMNKREHAYIDDILSCHEQNLDFVEIIHKAWRNFLSKHSGIVTLFVRNIDKMIRHDDKDIDIKAGNILAFFDYISDKDVFLERYRDLMINRLIDKYNPDSEYTVIQILKTKMGPSYVFPLISMMNDMKLNNNYKAEFDPNEQKRTTAMVLSVQWGIKTDYTKWILPSHIETELEEYISFFMNKHGRNKRVQPFYTLGQVIIKGIYDKKTYEFIMTPVQAMCFMAIGEGYKTIEEIADKVILSGDKDIQNILSSLVKGGLLKNEDHRWSINELYTSKRRINRIPTVELKVLKEKDGEVVANRGYVIDGVIMRIMKSRRRLSHTDLIVESGAQIKLFKPNVKDIKKRIDNLMEREYLERDEQDRSYYCYVA
jgi:cullin 1